MKKWIWILVSLLVLSSGFIFLRLIRISLPDAGMMPTYNANKSVFVLKTGTKKLERGNLIAFHDPSLYDKQIKYKTKHISRLVAFPGDTVRIDKKDIFINNQLFNCETPVFMKYRISTKHEFQVENLNNFHQFDLQEIVPGLAYELHCTPETAAEIGRLENVTTVRLLWELRGKSTLKIFPQSQYIAWNMDYYGPFIVPKAGVKTELNYKNYDLYKNLINIHEGKQSYVKSQKVYINGSPVSSYTFEKNYYFVINDNRDFPGDSRTLGPIPEDHIIGKKK